MRAQFIAGTALRRIGQPADIAAFLASNDARCITGHIVDASGGLHAVPTPDEAGA